METSRENAKKIVPVIEVDEQRLRSHVTEVVRQSVEETLNGLLDAEADALCQASRYGLFIKCWKAANFCCFI